MLDEAWDNAKHELEALDIAKEAIDNGETEQDFVDDYKDRETPGDTRSLGQKLLDASRAWADALQEIADKLKEEQTRSQADKELIDKMIAEAREAVGLGHSIEKFKNDQLWKKPAGRAEADIVEKAQNAYRTAELQLRRE